MPETSALLFYRRNNAVWDRAVRHFSGEQPLAPGEILLAPPTGELIHDLDDAQYDIFSVTPDELLVVTTPHTDVGQRSALNGVSQPHSFVEIVFQALRC